MPSVSAARPVVSTVSLLTKIMPPVTTTFALSITKRAKVYCAMDACIVAPSQETVDQGRYVYINQYEGFNRLVTPRIPVYEQEM